MRSRSAADVTNIDSEASSPACSPMGSPIGSPMGSPVGSPARVHARHSGSTPVSPIGSPKHRASLRAPKRHRLKKRISRRRRSLGTRSRLGTPKASGMGQTKERFRVLPAQLDGYSMVVRNIPLPYVECIRGPILLTAPHGLRLAGPRRSHLREKHTSELVLMLAKALKQHLGMEASFCVWNCKTAQKGDPRNLDPNFIRREEWSRSPWHTTLLKFYAKFKDRGVPCFHVDFHGKMDRKKEPEHRVDIGIEPFLRHPRSVGWTRAEVEELRESVRSELDTAFAGVEAGGKSCRSEPDPERLHGFWHGRKETTMTHQAILEGIPSVQLETPRSIRARLMTDSNLLARYAAAIAAMYRKTKNLERKHGVDGDLKLTRRRRGSVTKDSTLDRLYRGKDAVKQYRISGFPSYSGQRDEDGRARFAGKIGDMMDYMIRDAVLIDAHDTDKQV